MNPSAALMEALTMDNDSDVEIISWTQNGHSYYPQDLMPEWDPPEDMPDLETAEGPGVPAPSPRNLKTPNSPRNRKLMYSRSTSPAATTKKRKVVPSAPRAKRHQPRMNRPSRTNKINDDTINGDPPILQSSSPWDEEQTMANQIGRRLDQRDYFSLLNNDVMGHILSFLTKRGSGFLTPCCALICPISKTLNARFWFFPGRLGQSVGEKWTHTVFPFQMDSYELLEPKSQGMLDHVSALSLQARFGFSGLHQEQVQVLSQMPRLKYLSVKPFLAYSLAGLTHLESLVMGNSGDALLPSQLKSLYFTAENEWTALDARGFTQLESLQIRTDTLEEIIGLPDSLETLLFHGCKIFNLAPLPRKLTSLTLHGWNSETSLALKNLPKLSQINLVVDYRLSVGLGCMLAFPSMIQALTTCPHLVKLKIIGAGRHSLRELIPLAPQLKDLTIQLGQWDNFTWDGIEQFTQLRRLSVTLTEFAEANFAGSRGSDEDAKWAWDLISAPQVNVLFQLPKLKHVVLIGCMGKLVSYDGGSYLCMDTPTTCTCGPNAKSIFVNDDIPKLALYNCCSGYELVRCPRKECACNVLASWFPYFQRSVERQRIAFGKKPIDWVGLI